MNAREPGIGRSRGRVCPTRGWPGAGSPAFVTGTKPRRGKSERSETTNKESDKRLIGRTALFIVTPDCLGHAVLDNANCSVSVVAQIAMLVSFGHICSRGRFMQQPLVIMERGYQRDHRQEFVKSESSFVNCEKP